MSAWGGKSVFPVLCVVTLLFNERNSHPPRIILISGFIPNSDRSGEANNEELWLGSCCLVVLFAPTYCYRRLHI